MTRNPRAEVEGTISHVFQRGNRKATIFCDNHDRKFFLEQLRITTERYGWRLLAWCLMSNHYHLVIQPAAPTLGEGMRRLDSVHAQMFNRRWALVGHVFQGRYGSVVVRTDAQFAQLLRYVAFNPVAAKLCADPADWEWSSHRSLLAGRAESLICRQRLDELLAVPYASLFADDGPVPGQSLDRPSLEALLSLTPRRTAIRVALDYGYRQRDVAEVLGVSQPTVSRLLRE